MDGTEEMVVNDESRDMNLTGAGSTNFQFAKPDGWPAGKYKVYVSMNGNAVHQGNRSHQVSPATR